MSVNVEPKYISLNPPVSLTAGMPTPETIRKQKDAYTQMLDQQLQQGMRVLAAQVKHQKDYLHAQAEQQKNQFYMQIDMEMKQQEMALAQSQAEQKMSLQQQASQQKQQLEAQAMMLGMEYQKKKSEEDVQRQQYEMESVQHEIQSRLTAEMHKLGVSIPAVQTSSPAVSMMPNTLGLTQFGLSTQNLAIDISIPNKSVPTYVYGPAGELVLKENEEETDAPVA